MPRGSVWLLSVLVLGLSGLITVRGGGLPGACHGCPGDDMQGEQGEVLSERASPHRHAGEGPERHDGKGELAPANPSPAAPLVPAAIPAGSTATAAPLEAAPGARALEGSAPREVRFGVVLVGYQGAQGASGAARSKNDARALAEKLAEEAKTDFHGAVQHGDSGSADDAGRVPRGVLEAPVEAALFSLPTGGVTGLLDTPRGYWIAKRLE